MRKIYLVFSLMLLSLAVKAQFTSGQKLFGPSFSLSAGIDKSLEVVSNFNPPGIAEINNKKLSFGIGGSLIKMKTESMGIGFRLNYLHQYSKGTYSPVYSLNNIIIKSDEVSASIFKRKFYVLANKFNFYYDAGVYIGLGFSTDSYDYPSPSLNAVQKDKNYFGGIFLTPGLSYRLKKNLLAEASLNNLLAARYEYSKESFTDNTRHSEQSNGSFDLNSSINASNVFSNIVFSIKWIL